MSREHSQWLHQQGSRDGDQAGFGHEEYKWYHSFLRELRDRWAVWTVQGIRPVITKCFFFFFFLLNPCSGINRNNTKFMCVKLPFTSIDWRIDRKIHSCSPQVSFSYFLYNPGSFLFISNFLRVNWRWLSVSVSQANLTLRQGEASIQAPRTTPTPCKVTHWWWHGCSLVKNWGRMYCVTLTRYEGQVQHQCLSR